jgi:RNA polymerase sigma-70 factor (ECF subfamily)
VQTELTGQTAESMAGRCGPARESAMQAASDENLIEGIASGEHDCLDLLYGRYRSLAFATAFRVVGDHGRAEDVVQDAFLAVWRKAGSYATGRGSVRTWLTSIARNRAIDLVRSGKDRNHDDEELLLGMRDDGREVVDEVAMRLESEAVRAALTGLPQDQMQALSLAYFDGLSHSEIAQRTELPLGTVKSRIRLGLHRMRAALEQTGSFSGPNAAFGA